MSDAYVEACNLEDVPQIRPLRVEIGGRGILICKSGDSIYAVDEVCPHKNKSMKFGVVQRGNIICPHHRYKFDLETGRCRRRCAPATLFDVEVEDGVVYVEAPWCGAGNNDDG